MQVQRPSQRFGCGQKSLEWLEGIVIQRGNTWALHRRPSATTVCTEAARSMQLGDLLGDREGANVWRKLDFTYQRESKIRTALLQSNSTYSVITGHLQGHWGSLNLRACHEIMQTVLSSDNSINESKTVKCLQSATLSTQLYYIHLNS